MAERFITRTVTFAEVEGIIADMSTMTMEKRLFNFSGNLTDAADILTDIKKVNETDTLKVISVDMATVKKTDILYGMSEQDFLKYAKRMESRTKMEK